MLLIIPSDTQHTELLSLSDFQLLTRRHSSPTVLTTQQVPPSCLPPSSPLTSLRGVIVGKNYTIHFLPSLPASAFSSPPYPVPPSFLRSVLPFML